jgi:predicted glycosyltransferase involved in capsule biosynthesis
MGVHVSNADNLFFLDTDILLTEDFLSDAITFIRNKGTVVVNKVMETAMLHVPSDDNDHIEEIVTYLEVRAKDGRRAIIQNRRDSFTQFNRVGNGLIFVTRNDFLAVDGMNSALAGWGFEDDDFLLRLQLGAGLRATAMGTVTHLTHDNPMRDLNGKSVEEQIKLNYTIAVQRYKAGNYKGSYTSDMERWADQFEILGQ